MIVTPEMRTDARVNQTSAEDVCHACGAPTRAARVRRHIEALTQFVDQLERREIYLIDFDPRLIERLRRAVSL